MPLKNILSCNCKLTYLHKGIGTRLCALLLNVGFEQKESLGYLGHREPFKNALPEKRDIIHNVAKKSADIASCTTLKDTSLKEG